MKILLVLSLLMMGCGAPQKAKVSKPATKKIKASDFSAHRIIGGEFVRAYEPVYWRGNAIYEFRTADDYCRSLRLGYDPAGELVEMTCRSRRLPRYEAWDVLQLFVDTAGRGALKRKGETFHLKGIDGVSGRWNKADGYTFHMVAGENTMKWMVSTWFKTQSVERYLTESNISRVIRSKAQKIETCHREALTRNRYLRTKLVVKFTINSEGKVIRVGAGAVPSEKLLSRCVGEHFWRMRFRKPQTPPTNVEKTFNFGPLR